MIESQNNRVVLPDLSSIGVSVVVNFAYTGSLNLTLENVPEVRDPSSSLFSEVK